MDKLEKHTVKSNRKGRFGKFDHFISNIVQNVKFLLLKKKKSMQQK